MIYAPVMLMPRWNYQEHKTEWIWTGAIYRQLHNKNVLLGLGQYFPMEQSCSCINLFYFNWGDR